MDDNMIIILCDNKAWAITKAIETLQEHKNNGNYNESNGFVVRTGQMNEREKAAYEMGMRNAMSPREKQFYEMGMRDAHGRNGAENYRNNNGSGGENW